MFIRRKTHEALLKDITQEARGLGALAAKYKRERNDAEVALAIARAEADANKADAEALQISIEEERAAWVSTSMRLTVANARLSEIARQETPGANATVKRMAAIARGEMQPA